MLSASALNMLTKEQCRAARGALDWTQEELARRSNVAAITIRSFEHGADSKISTLLKLRRALEAGGIEFIEENAPSAGGGVGIRLTKPQKKPAR